MSSKDGFRKLEKVIQNDGWELLRVKGSHAQYVHPIKKGKVTIPTSSGGITKNIQLSVMRQAGIPGTNKKK